MNTNQSFIGAYSRNRRARGTANNAAPANQSIPAPHLAPASNAPAEDAASTEHAATAHYAGSAEDFVLKHAVSVSDAVAETAPMWIDQAEGQVLRVDTPVMPEPAMPEPAMPEPAMPEPAMPEPAMPEPAMPEPAMPEPAMPEPAMLEPAMLEPAMLEPAMLEPAVLEPAMLEPAMLEPAMLEPAMLEPAMLEPAMLEPAMPEPAMLEPEPQPSEPAVHAAQPANIESVAASLASHPVLQPPNQWAGASWEVDAFDIPSNVAELFFDEAFFRSIAEHMGESVRNGLRSVLVTSLRSGEGRSTVAIGTAIAAAATGLRVALVDADLASPNQAELLRLEIESDWVTAIRQGESLESVSIASLEDGVTLLPLSFTNEGNMPVTSMEIDRLLERLDGCFDLVMYDGSIINAWATARIASAVNSCLIVRDTRTTRKSEIASAAEHLRQQGVQGIGVVDNFCG